MNYHDIKGIESKLTESYTDRKFSNYLKFHYIIKFLHSTLFFWTISFVPFLIAPIYLYPEKKYHELCDKNIEELELTMEVLEDIKKERIKINT
ncbi:MAG: hypothetical protein FJZ67_02295 [Bacteroidetes bacterium]|nr:hypothetical protein [Bacteroidota bacterium]